MRHLIRPWRLAAVLCLAAGAAGAQTTTTESASLLVFPKVIVDDSWDTTIQLSNTANRPAHAVCYYVNGADNWSNRRFGVSLLRQQPTTWAVSGGRVVSEGNEFCTPPFESCAGTGSDPGTIPPVTAGFTGELLCYEVDASGAPWSGNALTGYATLTHRATGAVVKYPAIGSSGLPTNNANSTLCLGGESSEDCPLGAEYRGCPTEWIVSHRVDYDDSGSGGDASRATLTVVPCSQDLDGPPARVTLQVFVFNEFEQRLSMSTLVTCWTDIQLRDLGITRDLVGTDWSQTRIRAASSSPGGIVLLQQTARGDTEQPLLTVVASVPPQGDAGTGADLIRLRGGDDQ